MLARLPRASVGHAALLTPSISLRPVFPHFLFPNSFPCHRSENSPVSPIIATLPKTGVSNPCVCHTSETPRGASHSGAPRLFPYLLTSLPPYVDAAKLGGTNHIGAHHV